MRKKFLFGDRFLQVDVLAKEPLRVQITEQDEIREQVITDHLPAGEGRLLLGDRYVSYFVTEGSAGIWVTLAGETFYFEKTKGQGGAHEETHGGFSAPMPGKVIKVPVQEGASVEKGQVLVIMEAMKMEHRIEAPGPGTVTALHCDEGAVVDQGFHLLDFEEESDKE